MATKNNPGDFDCYEKLPPDEPYFLLRAQDVFAPVLVARWVVYAKEAGVNRAKIAEAERLIYDMERWQQQHQRRVPD